MDSLFASYGGDSDSESEDEKPPKKIKVSASEPIKDKPVQGLLPARSPPIH